MAVIDNKTPRLNLPLPNADNFLQDDVARLQDAFTQLDGEVATLAKGTTKLDPAQLPDNAAKVDNNGILLESQLPTKVVTTAQGKIPVTNLPQEALTNVRDASTQAGMLALPATAGDVCRRLDTGRVYLLTQAPATTLANWRELPPTAVWSINGKTGDVTNMATVDDIKNLTGVNGPLTLKADAAGDYDAVTLRQLLANGGGGGTGTGASGVMSNFIGSIEWFNGSRASIPAGYIAADGQLVSRTDAKTKSLWEAVKGNILNCVTDAEWCGNINTDPENFGKHRGKYSWGLQANGTTAGTKDVGDTFRVPDLNGKKVQGKDGWGYGTSSPALHLRGDTFGADGTKEAGSVVRNAAPNITGEFGKTVNIGTGTIWETMNNINGAFSGRVGQKNYLNLGAWTPTTGAKAVIVSQQAGYPSFLDFNASRSAASYGRDNTTEVRPNSAAGIWIIRANGAFSAASTAFSCYNGDATKPANGTVVNGGALESGYLVNGQYFSSTSLRTVQTIGGAVMGRISVTDRSDPNNPNGTNTVYNFPVNTNRGGDVAVVTDDSWYPFNHAKITEYINWGGGKQAATELFCRIGYNSIQVKGIVRGTFHSKSTGLFTVKKPLPGFTYTRMGYSPCVMQGNKPSYVEQIAGSLTASVYGLPVVGAPSTAVALDWIIVDIVIVFTN